MTKADNDYRTTQQLNEAITAHQLDMTPFENIKQVFRSYSPKGTEQGNIKGFNSVRRSISINVRAILVQLEGQRDIAHLALTQVAGQADSIKKLNESLNALGLIARQKQDEIDKLQMQRTRHQENYSALRLNYNRERALTDVLAAQLQKESIT